MEIEVENWSALGITGNTAPSMRALGNSDLRLSPIGFGTWAIGGSGWKYSLGPQDDNESIATIHCALDLGINWIDTAPVYGLGHSIELVARALKSASKKPYIFTKCSVRWHEDRSLYNSLKAESVAEEVEATLRCLGVETIENRRTRSKRVGRR
jgi:aryl-alcohol dehydrogenase-like predicted oxidoreductase